MALEAMCLHDPKTNKNLAPDGAKFCPGCCCCGVRSMLANLDRVLVVRCGFHAVEVVCHDDSIESGHCKQSLVYHGFAKRKKEKVHDLCNVGSSYTL